MKRVAIYTRVNSDEQANKCSLHDQELEARQACECKGWDVVHVYSDTGSGEQITKRPGLQQLLADAEAGAFDVVAVHTLNRVSRSLSDIVAYLGHLEQAEVTVISVTEDFDFTTPLGKFMLSMLATFADWQIDNLVIETQADLATPVLPDEWRAAMNVLLKALRRKVSGAATEADDELLRMVEQVAAG